MRHIKTPELLWPALRQYRHNTDNSPNINHPENGFVTGFDYDETVVVVKRLEQQLAEIREAAQPQQFDAVWKKYCELEQIDPDNASGISEIGASFIYMAGFSEGKHPQYALEAELAELVAERDSLRDLVKKSQDEVVSFVPMLVELAELREAVLAYVGPVNDPHIGWRGSSPSHNDLFQCEACGAEDADTRAMQHTDNCTAAALLATIGQKP